MRTKDTPDPDRPTQNSCGCVVTRSTGPYHVLCYDHRHLKDDPTMEAYTADAEEAPRRG